MRTHGNQEADPGSPTRRTGGFFVRLNQMEDGLLVACLLLMIFLSFVNITLRNTGRGGIVWADELLINLVLWVAMLGGAIASKDNNHITIDIVSNLTPPRFHEYFQVITNAFAAVVCGLLAYHSYQLVAVVEYPEHRDFIPHVESWVPMVVMPAGFAIMAFRFLRLTLRNAFRIFKGGAAS